MNFLGKIIGGKFDEETHNSFIRFGRGEYERFLLSIKKGKKLMIKCSADLANMMVQIITDNLQEEAEVKGKIVARYDCENDVPCEIVKYSKRGKLYTAELDTTLSPDSLKELYEKFKFQFFLLNIKAGDFKLKSGKSLPKPGGKIKPNFCSVTLPLSLLDEFAFDFEQDFKEVKIRHILHITDIIIPDEYKDDAVKARTHGIRKGIIKRIIELDGKETEKKYNFET